MPEPRPSGSSQGSPAEKKPWNRVNEPGCYVCNDTGRLIRAPASAFDRETHSPIVELSGPEGPTMVTRISTDARQPVEELRKLASNARINPQF